MRILIVLAAITFLSCNDNKNTTSSNIDTTDQVVKEPGDKPVTSDKAEGCYWKISQRDTLVIQLQQNGSRVNGKLSFDNYQKDGSSGTIAGRVEDGIMKVWYDFESEGMKSVMEIYFKKENDKLIRGVGPSAVKADTSYFTDPSAIKYDNNQAFEKVDCNTVPSKYRQ